MDAELDHSGHFSAINRQIAAGGLDALPQFLGYAYLSGLQQNGFIRAGVEGLSDDMTSGWMELVRNEESDDEDRIKKINEFLTRFKIRELFHKASTMNGYFGGCLVYIKTDDDDLTSALDEKSLKNSIRDFILVEPINCYPGRYNSYNPLENDYYKPRTWFILGQEVHASRLLYFRAEEVSMLLKPAYNFFGIAPAQVAADSVSHFVKDREAAARLLHKFSLLVFKTDMGSTIYNGNPEELYSRMKVLADFRDNDSVIAIDKEDEDILTVTTSIAGVTEFVRLSLELMPIMFRQPLTKFLGMSPGGLNATGESDENNWNEYVLAQCEKQLRTPLERVIELAQFDMFGNVDESIGFVFKKQSGRNETVKVNNNKIKADTYVVLSEGGIISPEEARKALAEDPESGFNHIDVSDVPEPTEEGNEDLFGIGMDWDPFAADKEFDENKINRKSNGQFGKGGASSGASGDPFGKCFGEFSYEPDRAIEVLLENKGGYVPKAMYKEGIGDIDFVYGEAGEAGTPRGYGLAHIIRRRNEEGKDGEAFVRQLPDIIKNGKVYSKIGEKDRVYIGTEDTEIAIRLTWDNKKRNWLVSGYVRYEKMKGL